MSLLGFACAAALVPLGLAAAWRRADWRYGLASLAAVVGLAANALAGKFPSSSEPALLDIPLALAAFVLAAEAIGLPQPIGRVLGFPGCDTSKHRVRFAEVLSVWSGPRDRRLCLATPGLR